MNGTLQDRMVKALRRAGIAELDAANKFADDVFLPEFNPPLWRDGVTAGRRLHRPLPPGTDLARVVSVQEWRVVANDWTVRWQNCVLQLPCEAAEFMQSGCRVTVCEPLDGKLRVFVGEQRGALVADRETRRCPSRVQAGRDRQGIQPRAEAGRRDSSLARPTNDRSNSHADHPHPLEEKKWPAPLRLAGARLAEPAIFLRSSNPPTSNGTFLMARNRGYF